MKQFTTIKGDQFLINFDVSKLSSKEAQNVMDILRKYPKCVEITRIVYEEEYSI